MMKSLSVFIAAFLIFTCISFGQNSTPKYLIRIQPYNGWISTHYSQPSGYGGSYIERGGWFQTGLQSSVLFPISFMNVGAGIGITYKVDAIYESKGIYPNAFIMLEIGNGKKRFPLSGIISFGMTENLIPIKSVPYISGGPSFNFKSHFEKVNISIYPFIEYYTGRHDIVTHSGTAFTGPIYTHHWVKFTTFTYNVSVIIQINQF